MSSVTDDVVKLLIDGREFSGWEEARIDMAIDQLADTFSLSGPFDPTDSALVAAVEPYKYKKATILLGSDVYLTGRLELPNFDTDPANRPFSLSGRSLPGILADCSCEVDETSEASALTFAQIARQKVCKPLGILVRDDDTQTATRTIPEARAAYGDTGFDFLHKLAAPHNLLLNSSYDGRLVITNSDDLVDYPLRAELVEGDPIIKSVHASFDSTKRFSLCEIASQFAGASDIVGSASDSTIDLYRPRRKAIEEADQSDPDATAARMMSEYIASSMSITATLVGWRRPDGGRWSERQIVTLKYPSAYLFKSARYVISGCSLKLSAKDGYTTELRLVPPEVYSSKIANTKSKKKVDLW